MYRETKYGLENSLLLTVACRTNPPYPYPPRISIMNANFLLKTSPFGTISQHLFMSNQTLNCSMSAFSLILSGERAKKGKLLVMKTMWS